MSWLIIHGGIGEVGGNKLLIESKEARVFLDFGISFSMKRRYYSGFIKAKRFRMLDEYIMTGVLPRIYGVYRTDIGSTYERHEERPSIDACIISHAHLDHCGHISLLRPEITVYAGTTAKILIEAREDMRTGRGPEDQIVNYKDYRTDESGERPFITFSTGMPFSVKDMRVNPIHVDHSVPASYAFIVESDDFCIAYTGDLRFHGPMRWMTEEFVEMASRAGVETLIIEGTRVDDDSVHSEDAVREEMRRVMREAEGHAVASLVGLLDFDRLMSLLQASESVGRELLLSPKLAYILHKLSTMAPRIRAPSLKDDRISVYMEPTGTGGDGSLRDYRGWLRSFMESCMDTGVKLVGVNELSKWKKKYVFAICQPEDVPEIIHMEPDPGSAFMFSSSEPHNEEQEIEREKVANWVGLLGMRMVSLHASGHASRVELLDVISRIMPKRVVPIHTEHPEMFRRLIEGSDLGVEVLVPRGCERLTLA